MDHTDRTNYLDGIRALSALWVVVAHCMIWSGYSGYIPNPKIAVAIFMVLSGYLMAHTAGRGGSGDFYLRRFFRIAPLYYAVLFINASFPIIGEGLDAWDKFEPGDRYSAGTADFSAGNIALHMAFLAGFSDDTNATTMLPDWSLMLEAQFYAVFPLVWFAMARWGIGRVAAVLALPCIVYWLSARTDWHDPSFLPLQAPYFLAGILVHQAQKSPPLLVGALLLSAFEFEYWGMVSLAIPASVGLIFFMDRSPARILRALLGNRLMCYGGLLSYGVYLTHGRFIALAGHFQPPWWALTLIVLGGSVAISSALYVLVERPGVRLGRVIAKRYSRRRAVRQERASSANPILPRSQT